MPVTLWLLDESTGKGWRAASLEDRHVAMLRDYLDELEQTDPGHRAKAVFVDEVYDQELYDKTRRPTEAPVSEGHTFPSAIEAAYHLGLKSPVVRDAIRNRRKRPGLDSNADGVAYPKGTVRLGGLAMCWAADADV